MACEKVVLLLQLEWKIVVMVRSEYKYLFSFSGKKALGMESLAISEFMRRKPSDLENKKEILLRELNYLFWKEVTIGTSNNPVRSLSCFSIYNLLGGV